MTLNRRKFLTGAAVSGAILGAPAIASAQSKTTFNWKMTNAYGPGSPFYVQGPGSPTDFCKKVRRCPVAGSRFSTSPPAS